MLHTWHEINVHTDATAFAANLNGFSVPADEVSLKLIFQPSPDIWCKIIVAIVWRRVMLMVVFTLAGTEVRKISMP